MSSPFLHSLKDMEDNPSEYDDDDFDAETVRYRTAVNGRPDC